VFGASVLFVFMVLAAQYESWSQPLAVILIVPMCLLAAVSGLLIRGLSIDILAQIGFVVLVALASKNAILIVEFAKQAEDVGGTVRDAAVQAARTRLRPILMTSLAFILGVVPLAVATGAGAEMRQSLGTAVIFGMLGVTLFGLQFTPTFYAVVRQLSELRLRRKGGSMPRILNRITGHSNQPRSGREQTPDNRASNAARSSGDQLPGFPSSPVSLNQKPKLTGANFGHRK